MKSLKPHVIVSAFQSGSDFLNLIWEDQLQNLDSFGSGVTVDLLFSAVYQLQHHQDWSEQTSALNIQLRCAARPAVLKKTSQNISKSLSTSAHVFKK